MGSNFARAYAAYATQDPFALQDLHFRPADYQDALEQRTPIGLPDDPLTVYLALTTFCQEGGSPEEFARLLVQKTTNNKTIPSHIRSL